MSSERRVFIIVLYPIGGLEYREAGREHRDLDSHDGILTCSGRSIAYEHLHSFFERYKVALHMHESVPRRDIHMVFLSVISHGIATTELLSNSDLMNYFSISRFIPDCSSVIHYLIFRLF